jgi:hypothetical protein
MLADAVLINANVAPGEAGDEIALGVFDREGNVDKV